MLINECFVQSGYQTWRIIDSKKLDVITLRMTTHGHQPSVLAISEKLIYIWTHNDRYDTAAIKTRKLFNTI